jgi:sulfane dehydrogenase subunit SoxC
MREPEPIVSRSRRWFLRAASLSAALFPIGRRAAAQDLPATLGAGVSDYGSRSRWERARRLLGNARQPQATASFTPLGDSVGIITPSSLHFERHHSGVPDLNPETHTLTIHGLVDRPTVFTLAELKRMPSVTRILFLECSGNSSSEWLGANAADVQRSHGLTSCSEWTGVPLAALLRACGVQPAAKWILTEGADAARLDRSLPLEKALADVLVAYAQNGEALRPEQGFPLRLIVPGVEGIGSTKWLHRVKVLDQPAQTREETSKYTDLLADGKARSFTLEMDVKSVITRPSGGQKLSGAGVYEITGLAWSGAGAIASVDVTVDGGRTWTRATLQDPVLDRAHARFRYTWNWDGRPALIASRATDSAGRLQPTLTDLLNARGINSGYHQNAIQVWKIAADGAVTNGL